MKSYSTTFAWLLVISMLSVVQSAEKVQPIEPTDFDRLHALIKPREGESPWREVAWETNVTKARQRSIAENKPIFIFTAADGSPLGRT